MTLLDICQKLSREHPFNTLEIMYRTACPGFDEDMLLGYCIVEDGANGFTIRSEDGDSYFLNDEILRYEYMPNYFDGLVVWIATNWS